MTLFQINFIAGFMVGIEFPPPEDEETFVMTIDLGIVRITMINTQ
jgi:hypothetical protein